MDIDQVRKARLRRKRGGARGRFKDDVSEETKRVGVTEEDARTGCDGGR